MKRLPWFSAFLAVLFTSFAGFAQVGAPVAGASGPPSGTYTQAQQITSAQALRTPWNVSKAAIPLIYASTGSIANNCAITGLTALDRTYANAYIYLPANAIVAASAAGWYFFQGSSTTAGTCFNNTYTTGTPTIPASPTAFATTGPGAFTGATGQVTAISVTLPANTMGANGEADLFAYYSVNNTAGSKVFKLNFGATAFDTVDLSNSVSDRRRAEIFNVGLTNSQIGGPTGLNAYYGTTTVAPVPAAVATSSDVALTITANKAVATDFMVVQYYRFDALSDGT